MPRGSGNYLTALPAHSVYATEYIATTSPGSTATAYLHHSPQHVKDLSISSSPYYQPSAYQPSASAATAVSVLTQLQYLRYSEPLELTPPSLCPLDLSIKSQQQNPITPPTTPSPLTPTTATTVTSAIKRKRSESPENLSSKWIKRQERTPPPSLSLAQPSSSSTSSSSSISPPGPPRKIRTTCTIIPSTSNASSTTTIPTKRPKAARKLNFDEDKSSPVSGTIIRELGPDETLVVRKGDIDPAYNVVEVTEEAKAELAKIENHIGDYVCRLCKELYEDAFQLAQHRCSRIVHVEYRCPECDKVFNCPANLASHRRWHKPRTQLSISNNNNNSTTKNQSDKSNDPESEQFPCLECGKKFRRQAYLRKHLITHSPSSTPTISISPPMTGAQITHHHQHHPNHIVEMAEAELKLGEMN